MFTLYLLIQLSFVLLVVDPVFAAIVGTVRCLLLLRRSIRIHTSDERARRWEVMAAIESIIAA
jgi:hypothetical protein